MIWGFPDVSMTPETNIIIFGDTRIPQIMQENFKSFVKNTVFGDITIPFLFVRKRRAQNNHEDPSYKFSKILKMGSISSNKK